MKKLKYILEDLRFLKALNSPFKPFKLKWYVGKVAIGTPYFLPRKLVKNKEKPGRLKFVPRKIGFNFVRLGWKTKYKEHDYRFEWAPMLSFVFFKWQIVVMVRAPEQDHYWEAWLYYEHNTDKRLPEWLRIRQCREEFPLLWTVYHKDPKTGDNTGKETVDYYNHILKSKYLN